MLLNREVSLMGSERKLKSCWLGLGMRVVVEPTLPLVDLLALVVVTSIRLMHYSPEMLYHPPVTR